MIIINSFSELDFQLINWKKNGSQVGFVPTMGALHDGHASLIKHSQAVTQKTICSIFVNPLQFNNVADYEKYPVTLDHDMNLLRQLNCDVLFLPDEKEVYPDESSRQKHYPLGHLENILEGKFRPGHFQGVCRVMERLLKMVGADVLFLGEKDYQQCLVIEKLIRLENIKISVVRCPTLREKSGLAKSSRNLRLSKQDLVLAAGLYEKLLYIKKNLPNELLDNLLKKAQTDLSIAGFEVEYIALARAADLEVVHKWDFGEKYVLLIAAWLSGIRLIDNIGI